MTTAEYRKLLAKADWHDKAAQKLRKQAGEEMPTSNDIRGRAEPLSYKVFTAKIIAGEPYFSGIV